MSTSAGEHLNEPSVWLCRQPGGTMARYRLGDFASPHWSDVSGGRGQPASDSYVHGYVMCDGALEGDVGHSGSHGPCPHRIKVCAVAKNNSADVMRQIKEAAGDKPTRSSNASRALDALAAAGPDGLTNQRLFAAAWLSNEHGPAALNRLASRGLITWSREKRPNRAGRLQDQVVWRIQTEGAK